MTTNPDRLANYAYGWDTGTHLGTKVIAKAGKQTGSRTYIRIYPEENLVIVLAANTRGSTPRELAKDIAKEIFP